MSAHKWYVKTWAYMRKQNETWTWAKTLSNSNPEREREREVGKGKGLGQGGQTAGRKPTTCYHGIQEKGYFKKGVATNWWGLTVRWIWDHGHHRWPKQEWSLWRSMGVEVDWTGLIKCTCLRARLLGPKPGLPAAGWCPGQQTQLPHFRCACKMGLTAFLPHRRLWTSNELRRLQVPRLCLALCAC